LERGAPRIEDRLREQTRAAMQHQPQPLAPEIVRELDSMAATWDARI